MDKVKLLDGRILSCAALCGTYLCISMSKASLETKCSLWVYAFPPLKPRLAGSDRVILHLFAGWEQPSAQDYAISPSRKKR